MLLNLPARPQLGWWAVVSLCVIAGVALHGDLDRLENPEGDKHVPLFPAGQIDFSITYLGARALVAGVNPYHNSRPEFTHPLIPPDAHGYKQMYPPGGLLLLAPFAWWKGADWEAAGRIWFRLSLIELGFLGVMTWALMRRIVAVPLTPVWIPFLYVCLTLNTGVELALERGQSDIAVALLAWGAVGCFLRGRHGTSTFLSIWSTSIKGYSILLAVGLFLLAFDRRHWKQLFCGAALAFALLVAPVWRYWGESMGAVKLRSDMFWGVWYNHGFSNAAYYVVPAWREKGRLLLSLFALSVSIAAWIQARRAISSGVRRLGALWLTIFATASLGTMIGYGSLSISYNLVLVLPGVLTLVACQDRLRVAMALPQRAEHALGTALFVTSILLFSYRLGGDGPAAYGAGLPSSAFGLVALFVILAVVLAAALGRSRDPGSTPVLTRPTRPVLHPTGEER